MNKKIFILIYLNIINISLIAEYSCPPSTTYQCSDNPVEEIYPNQNMCQLLAEIPPQLRNLPYAMYPNCDIYNTNRFGYNKRFNVFPHAIITPENQEQVAYVLSVLKEFNLLFSVRSGGHSYETGSLSNGYIIDLRNFNSIIPDIENQTVYIGAGNHLGGVIQTLGEIDYAIPTGTCPAVGVAGLTLGGGIGELARPYGLTCDSVISITMVTADSKIIEITESSYPELFYALRGSGANSYGIVLGFKFKMYHIPKVSYVTLTWPWNPELAPKIFDSWQKWFPSLPDSITSEIVFKYDSRGTKFTISIFKANDEPVTEWQNTFARFNPIVKSYNGNYLGAAELFASNYTLPFSKAKSKFLFKPLCLKAFDNVVNFFDFLDNAQEEYIAFLSFGSAHGGAISEGESSYFPRKAFEWLYFFIYWQYEQQETSALGLIDDIYKKLEPYTSPYSYANLVDYDLGKDYLKAYYGSHVNKLIKIKNAWDPTNLFNWKQGIPLKKPAESSINFDIKEKYCQNF